MKTRLLFLLFLSGAGPGLCPAQGLPAPGIRPGQAWEFQSTEGQAYFVETSGDGVEWRRMAGPLFGNGGQLEAMVPDGYPAFRDWRVRTVDPDTIGPATTAFGSHTLSLNDEGRSREVILFPAIQGVQRGILKIGPRHARNFVWAAKRLTAEDVELSLQFQDGTGSTIDLTFSSNQLGGYRMRDRSEDGILQVTEGGSFSLHDGRLPVMPQMPVIIGGQSLIIEEGGRLTRMEFGANGKVLLHRPDHSVEQQTYQYSRNSISPSLATLKVGDDASVREEYQFNLQSPSTGNVNRIPPPQLGNDPAPPPVVQTGTFNLPTDAVITTSTTGPPVSLDGKVIELTGEDPVTLTFHPDGTGTATREDDGSVEVTPFIYDYSRTGNDDASLALTFPGAENDLVEDYNLNFSGTGSGSYESSTFAGGELAHSSSGEFAAATP